LYLNNGFDLSLSFSLVGSICNYVRLIQSKAPLENYVAKVGFYFEKGNFGFGGFNYKEKRGVFCIFVWIAKRIERGAKRLKKFLLYPPVFND
jgi:hypothetical protein